MLEKEARRQKVKELESRGKQKMDDGQLVQKMLDEYEKGAQAQDDAMAEEKHRQFESVKAMIEERKAKVAETRRKK